MSYTTKGLASYGTIQPGILVMKADVEGVGQGIEGFTIAGLGRSAED